MIEELQNKIDNYMKKYNQIYGWDDMHFFVELDGISTIVSFFNFYNTGKKYFPKDMNEDCKEILIELKPYLDEELNKNGITEKDVLTAVKFYKETPKIYMFRKNNYLSLRQFVKILHFYIDLT